MANVIEPLTPEQTLLRGFKNSRSAVRSMFQEAMWATNNLPRQKRRELDALGSHLVRCMDLLDLESTEGLPLDVWKEIRDELSDTLCGKAIFLTQRLANCVADLKANRNFLAEEDLDRFKLDVHRIKMKQDCPELKQFVRFTISRLEKLFAEASKVTSHIEFGASRSVTSLLCMHWRMLTRMRIDPECIFNPQGVLTRRDMLGLKSRHLLGTEGGISIFADNDRSH